jgi:hypothetical protein
VRNSPLVNDMSKELTSTVQSEYTFINFNFEST